MYIVKMLSVNIFSVNKLRYMLSYKPVHNMVLTRIVASLISFH